MVATAADPGFPRQGSQTQKCGEGRLPVIIWSFSQKTECKGKKFGPEEGRSASQRQPVDPPVVGHE